MKSETRQMLSRTMLTDSTHTKFLLIPVADPEISISGGLLHSYFSDSLYNQQNFYHKRGGLGPQKTPLNPPLYTGETIIHIYFNQSLEKSFSYDCTCLSEYLYLCLHQDT